MAARSSHGPVICAWWMMATAIVSRAIADATASRAIAMRWMKSVSKKGRWVGRWIAFVRRTVFVRWCGLDGVSHDGSDVGGDDDGGSDFGGDDVGGSDFRGSDFGGDDVGGSDVGGSDVGGRDGWRIAEDGFARLFSGR
ncbi:MAG: hypothetical protein FWD57_10595 [Polyangiaceae bacterium]|nr:hypothetical protein [Polyangiaceae bacterium]